MSTRFLPKRTKLSSALSRGALFEGALAVTALPRLAEAAGSAEGGFEVAVRAFYDPAHSPALHMRIEGGVSLVCQRCLRRYMHALLIDTELRPVSSEAEEARLLREHEPLWIEDDSLELHTLVEDEALLALPLAPRCEKPDCETYLETGDDSTNIG